MRNETQLPKWWFGNTSYNLLKAKPINKNSDSLIFVINIDRRRYISQKTARSVQKLSCSMYCSFCQVTAFVIYEFLSTGDMYTEFPVYFWVSEV